MFHPTDLKYPFRLLAKRPRFTVLTVLVLAGGLAVSLYTYAVLNTMVYKPLPIPEGASVVRVVGLTEGGTFALDAYELAQLRGELESLRELGVFRMTQARLGDQESSRAVGTAFSEWSIFEFTRTQPAMGRGLVQADHLEAAENVAVISHELWQSAFAGDPGVIGRLARVNGEPTRIVGVMPEGYGFPMSEQLWLPLPAAELNPLGYGETSLDAYARLAPGVSAETAETELTALLRGLRQQAPEQADLPVLNRALVASTQGLMMGPDGARLFAVLNTMALFILVLACVNVGNLLLARTNERIKEISVRAALGAPRLRLMLQMVSENVLVCLAGGLVALLLVSQALEVTGTFTDSMLARLYAEKPFWWQWQLDDATLVAAVIFTLATIFLVSILPMYSVAGADPAALLRGGTHGGRGHAVGAVSRVLVSVQIALMVTVMLVGGAMASVAYRATQIDFGFDTAGLFRMPTLVTGSGYDTSAEQLTFYERLLEELRGDVGIEAAMAWRALGRQAFAVDGAEYVTDDDYPQAALMSISETPIDIEARLLQGRRFDERDTADALPAVIVSETVASRFWPGGSAVGQRLRLRNGDGSEEPRIVVGVVSDVSRGSRLEGGWDSFAALYVPMAQAVGPFAQIVFRHRGGEAEAREAAYRALAAVDPAVPPVGNVMSYAAVLEQAPLFARTLMSVFAGCTVFAILLAMAGIYGLSSNAVVRRTHEIGLRRAIGASDGRVIKLFLAEGTRQLALGLVASVFLSVGLFLLMARFSSELGGINAFTLTLSGAAIALIVSGAVLTAIYLAIHRAVRHEPGAALRYG